MADGEFKFLPGHKTLILNISDIIKAMDDCDNKIRKVCSKEKALKKSLDDVQLKKQLITNLLKYSGKIGFQLPSETITESNISNFERGAEGSNYVCKCRFICPFCPKVFPLAFKTFWQSSNVSAHLKSHISSVDVETD